LRKAEKFWTNFCNVVVRRWQHDPPQDDEPDLSGVLALPSAIVLLAPSYTPVPSFLSFMPLLLIFYIPQFLPLFRLGV